MCTEFNMTDFKSSDVMYCLIFECYHGKSFHILAVLLNPSLLRYTGLMMTDLLVI